MTSEELDLIISKYPTLKGTFGFQGNVTNLEESSRVQGSGLMNWDDGIPNEYASQIKDDDHPFATGKHIIRADLNAIGEVGTREYFLKQMGGYHTFDERVARVIGGYPYGAILDWFQESTSLMRQVMCVKPGGNCFLSIEDEIHGVEGSSDHYWTFIDIKDQPKVWNPNQFPFTISSQTQFISPIDSTTFRFTMPCDGMISFENNYDYKLFLQQSHSNQIGYTNVSSLYQMRLGLNYLSETKLYPIMINGEVVNMKTYFGFFKKDTSFEIEWVDPFVDEERIANYRDHSKFISPEGDILNRVKIQEVTYAND